MENGPSDVKLPKIRQVAGKNTRSDGFSAKSRQGTKEKIVIKMLVLRLYLIAGFVTFVSYKRDRHCN